MDGVLDMVPGAFAPCASGFGKAGVECSALGSSLRVNPMSGRLPRRARGKAFSAAGGGRLSLLEKAGACFASLKKRKGKRL